MKEKKGFTLIELLVILVILALLLIIAIPQILNVLNNSRDSAWKDSVKLVEDTLEVSTGYNSNNSNVTQVTLNDLCTSDATNKIKQLANIGDMTISCQKQSNKYLFSLSGINEFEEKSALISCISDGDCKIENYNNTN